MLTLNALVAADSVLVPLQTEYYALEGLSALLDTIEQIRISVNPAPPHRGPAAHHVRPAQQPVQRRLVEAGRAFRRQGVPHRDPAQRALAEAPSYGQSILLYDKNSRGSMAYLALAGEVTRRDAKQHHYAPKQ